MRKLFCIPIVHTSEDLGSHLSEVKNEYIARFGLLKWHDHTEAVEKFWLALGEILLNMPMDYTKVRLYQDSLPVCSMELAIIEKLANDGNRNYRILLELTRKGAVLEGSEDPDLLIEERSRLNEVSRSHKKGVDESVALHDIASSYDDLMERRDRYIAQRIAITLKDGEIGILFIGALHRVAEKLPADIEVHSSLKDLKIEITNS
jgi:hypothetical protein